MADMMMMMMMVMMMTMMMTMMNKESTHDRNKNVRLHVASEDDARGQEQQELVEHLEGTSFDYKKILILL